MSDYRWDSSLTYARSQVWNNVLLPTLDHYKIKPDENILELTHNDQSVVEQYLSNEKHQGDIDVLRVSSKHASFFDEIDKVSPRYHAVFCFLYLEELHVDIATVLKYIHKALHPGGRLVIALPFINLHTSARSTFQQVIDSGEFPEISQENLIYNSTLVPRIEAAIKDIFPSFHTHTFKNAIELESLDFFKDYLNEVAYIYKKVIPVDLNNKIIERQAAYFEARNKKENPGKLIFKYELNVIETAK